MADQSFSSFADLKEFRAKLRQEEAQLAQAKADAIEVKAGSEHLNPLKREAQAAQAALRADQKAAEYAHEIGIDRQQRRHQRQRTEPRREPSSEPPKALEGRPERAPRGERQPRQARGDRGERGERGERGRAGPRASAPLKGHAKDEAAAKRLNKALGRLQRKADELNSHHDKDAQAESARKPQHKHRGPQQAAQAPQAPAQKVPAPQAALKVAAQKGAPKSGAKTPAVPQLQGKYFDLESLKLVRANADLVKYQSRGEMFRRLGQLDQLIQKEVARRYREEQAELAAGIEGIKTHESAQDFLPEALQAETVRAFKYELKQFVAVAKQWLVARETNLPKLVYPESLPVSQRRAEIVKALQEHQVVIIAGETGSGKTTQIPKMCLEAGLGRKGLIGHTQPRRIAARAVASRIAEEMGQQVGGAVAYKVRFTDISSDDAYIKLMTDGILLSELAQDRMLWAYDVIIIDEAHERSLNIDFLLGYLKNLLAKRPELKLIITSATIDVERFSEHFNHAPIIEVSGRTYPVEVVYMPLMEDGKGVYVQSHDGTGRYESAQVATPEPDLGEGPGAWRDYNYEAAGGSMAALRAAAQASAAVNGAANGAASGATAKGAASPKSPARAQVKRPADDDRDLADTMDLRQGILQAFNYLQARGRGDTLVFLPGERDILEIAQFLRKAGLRDTEIVPLYARLATGEQNKIFAPHTGVRIVLATNVAETSLTVPGIRYVIDPGLARISRYSARTKIQRLPIEPISQASANQRKGRCGRVSDGICVRLYSKEDFDQRRPFTEPEILRTNLASVLLQMSALRLGDIERFPFIDAPQERQVTDGLRLLDELGAITMPNVQLTPIGRMLSRLPCDPRLARMIVEADRFHCLSEILVIVSNLAVMDPREYPLDKKEAATNMHRRFNDDKSDFVAILKLYDYIKGLQEQLSNTAVRRQLKQEFISFLRVREWFDVYRQLRVSSLSMGLKLNEERADYESIHRAIVSGLLSHLGMIEPNGNQYIGARGSKFLIFPGSGLAKKPPKWLCASELSETSRLFARTVAAIDPSYAETQAAAHLIKDSYNEPHWSKKMGSVMAYQTRTLYGLPIVQRRLVQYQKIDPRLSHELMIRDGFVGGNIECKHRFYQHNLSMIDDVEYLEDKVRRRDLLVDGTTLELFYQERIPEHICNLRDFDTWWRSKEKSDPHFLDFSYELIAKGDLMAIEEQLYPEFWHQGALRFKLSYCFDPGQERDGVTVHIPITVLNQVKAEDFLWQIPGLRSELFASLIRSLPKRLRRNLIPAPEYAQALAESLKGITDHINVEDSTQPDPKRYPSRNLFAAVAHELTRMGGEVVTVEDFDKSLIEPYLFVNFLIEAVNGSELAWGKDFTLLSARLQNQARAALHEVVKTHKVAAPAQAWQYGAIKREQVTKQGSLSITAYPALTDRGEGVTLELYDSPQRQMKAMRQGAIKLLALSLKAPTAYLETHLPNRAKLSMYYQPLGSIKELIEDLMLCAINNIMERNGGIPWDEAHFARLREIVRGELNDEALAVAKLIEQSLVKAHELRRLLKGSISFDLTRSYADMQHQLDGLIYKGFISKCGMTHLKELPRYLQAALERLQRLQRDVVRDQMYLRNIEYCEDEYHKALKSYHADLVPEQLYEVKWMIEELRVSYYAQHLGVIGPISDKRVITEIDRILREYPPQK